ADFVGQPDAAAAGHGEALGGFAVERRQLGVGERAAELLEQGSAAQLGEGAPAACQRRQQGGDRLVVETRQGQLRQPVREAAGAGEEGGALGLVQGQRRRQPYGGGRRQQGRRALGIGRRHLALVEQ